MWGVVILLAGTLLAGCPGGGRAPGGGNGTPGSGSTVRLEFWHTRRRDQEKSLQAICEEFERATPGVAIEPSYQGSYDELNKKLRASIEARSLPALAVAYESQVMEYMAGGVVRPLDDLVQDPEIGLKADDLADIPELYLESNRYPHYENKLLSFPFTKSNLVMYYNKSLLQKAGFTTPPQTWGEFENQAAAVTKLIDSPAYAFSLDASTLDGIIYSHGGEVLAPDGKHTLFDQPPAVNALEMLQRMAKAKTLTLTAGDNTGALFNSQRCAFVLDSSSARASAEKRIGNTFDWDIAVIPHADGVEPVTVMYGGNICVFKSTPEQERAAWKFVQFFTSPAVTARWARETGYLPVRKSAVELPEMKAFYQENPRARHVYEILPMAKGEPNVVGWQEIRSQLEDAAQRVIGSGEAPVKVARELKQKADKTLIQSQ
jgi:ABC-type glycerol-3-phosphate transport system substrate-binding protein